MKGLLDENVAQCAGMKIIKVEWFIWAVIYIESNVLPSNFFNLFLKFVNKHRRITMYKKLISLLFAYFKSNSQSSQFESKQMNINFKFTVLIKQCFTP